MSDNDLSPPQDEVPSGDPSGDASDSGNGKAPYPGSKQMPQWNTANLIDAPRFSWRNWAAMIGPGLVMGAAAIGGGEWLAGPMVTARYGGALMWLATISILCQGIYNIEICRYTLYTGEPIFTGKFRTMPGPHVWLIVYVVLDFGSVFPYLAANAATPVHVVLLGGELPDPENVALHWWQAKVIATVIFILGVVPLLFGGKVYNTLKVIMSVKLVLVIGFLLILAILYSRWATWGEIFSGFLKFGNVPVQKGEDLNGNGVLDPGEDWDGDGHLDAVPEKRFEPTIDTDNDGKPDAWEKDENGNEIKFEDLDGDGYHDGENVENVFVTLFTEGRLPDIDFTLVAMIAALAAIAGNGGLSNTPISNFTRDQGWGMGHHVGAIPSMIGGQGITLSHTGTVFHVDKGSLPRWTRWYKHVVRDQMFVWVPACFIGVALPAMLSVQFLRRGTEADSWNAAVMTAEGVQEQVANPPAGVLAHDSGLSNILGGEAWGNLFWCMTLLCGFLVLAPSVAATIDGIIRRWVDVFWTANSALRRTKPDFIRIVYFRVLVGYFIFGMIMLWANKPKELLKYATIGFNFALGFSSWHTIFVNSVLLPKQLRPNWFVKIALIVSGLFFVMLGTIATLKTFGVV